MPWQAVMRAPVATKIYWSRNPALGGPRRFRRSRHPPAATWRYGSDGDEGREGAQFRRVFSLAPNAAVTRDAAMGAPGLISASVKSITLMTCYCAGPGDRK